jgi:c-di-GMP-related signal transduction protein
VKTTCAFGMKHLTKLGSDMHDIFVGRQSIYDDSSEIVAYELLFRDGETNAANFTDGDSATCQVLLNTLIDIGIDEIAGPKDVFVNFTRSFLSGECPIPFDADRFVIEILEDVVVDDELIEDVKKLSQRGYRIALDDFIHREEFEPLLEIVDIVKIDLLLLDKPSIKAHVNRLRKYPVKLLAEKIDTIEMFDFCKDLGFDLFQGYFLSEPNIVQGQRIAQNRLAILQLLAKLQDPKSDAEEIESLVCQDVSLSYRLLRYVNSSAVGARGKIESISQAIVLLGLNRLRTMIAMMMLAGIEDKPQSQLKMALMRAMTTKLLGRELGRCDQESAFMVGLFSALDVLMDSPLDNMLKDLPLADEVRVALLEHGGAMGDALNCTLALERADWSAAKCKGLKPQQVQNAYIESLAWVETKGANAFSESSADTPQAVGA